MIALLLIIFTIAVCVSRWKSKWNSLNQAIININEVDPRNEQQLAWASTEASYECVRGDLSYEDTDNLITEQNLAYEPIHIETSPNVAYRSKTAVHYHNPLTESLLQSDEYAYISQPT